MGDGPPVRFIRFQVINDQKTHKPKYHFTLQLSLEDTLKDARRQIDPKFHTHCKQFRFLWKERRIKKAKETSLKLLDILPKLYRGIPHKKFQFQHVSYEKFKHCTNGKDIDVTCALVVFLWEDDGFVEYNKEDLQSVFYGEHLYGFSYIPYTILSTEDFNCDGIEEICELASSGKLQELKLLHQSSSVESTVDACYDHRLSTPLHYAASCGHLDICEYLIQKSGPEALLRKDADLRSPLHSALLAGQMSIVAYFLSLKPDLDSEDVLGQSCKKMLYTLNNRKIDLLLEQLEFRNLDDHIVLFLSCLAIQLRNITAAQKLCKIVKPAKSSYCKQPLHLCAEFGDVDMIDSLVNRVDLPSHSPLDHDKNNHLPLHYACQHGHCQIIPMLYSDVLTEKDFQKAVKLTVDWKKYDVLQRLSELRSDFKLNTELEEVFIAETELNLSQNVHSIAPVLKTNLCANQRIVSEAVRQNTIPVLNFLSSLNYQFNLQDEMGRTALHEACELNLCDAIDFLLDKDVDCNTVDWQGSTPLHYACKAGSLEAVSLLLKRSISNCLVDITDNKGRSPLLVAASRGNTDVVIYMLENTSCEVWMVDTYSLSLLNYLITLDGASISLILNVIRRCDFDNISVGNNQDIISPVFGKHRPKKTARFQCQLCEKKWYTFAWHSSFTHMCYHEGKKFLKKIRRTKSNLGDIVRLPHPSTSFQAPSHTDLIISSIESHLVAGKIDYVELLLNLLDVNLPMDSLCYLCGLCVKYQCIKALEITIKLWEIPQYLLNMLLLIALLMESNSSNLNQNRLQLVRFLLQSGACPNFYIDDSSFEDNSTQINDEFQRNLYPKGTSLRVSKTLRDNFNQLLDKLLMTKKVKRHSVYLPLELAVISNDHELVKTLVQTGASVQICFALHLTLITKNDEMLNYLLSAYTSPCAMEISEAETTFQKLYEISTHQGGILQALSFNVSSNRLKQVLEKFPRLLSTCNVLTSVMVEEVRPQLFSCNDLMIHHIFYQHSKNQELHLTMLMKNSHGTDFTFKDILKNSPHLGGINIEKDTIIHCACELFVTSVQNCFWNECYQLLSSSAGAIIGQCLLSERSYCHKYVYQLKVGDDDSVTSTSIIQRFLFRAPVSCIKILFDSLRITLSTMDLDEINEIIRRLNPDSDSEDDIEDVDEAMKLIAFHILESVNKKPEGILCASKMLLVLSNLFHDVLNTNFIFRMKYIQSCLQSEEIGHLDDNRPFTRLIQRLHTIKPEVRLMKLILKLSPKEKSFIIERNISLTSISCIFGELEILKVLVCQSQEETDSYMLDVAAAFSQLDVMNYVLSGGVAIKSSTISAACTGTVSVDLTQWSPKITKKQKEELVLKTIKWIFERVSDYEESTVQELHQTLLDHSVKMCYWSISRWCLHITALQHFNLSHHSEVFMAALVQGPADVCLKLLKIPSFDWTSFSQKEASEMLKMVVTRNDELTSVVLLPLLSAYQFAGLGYLKDKDTHKRNIVHFVCSQGRIDVLNIILQNLATCSIEDISQIINAPDQSNAAPLWYAISNSHWKIAKLLLLNGCVLSVHRWVPCVTRKRTYAFENAVDPVNTKRGKGRRRSCQLVCFQSTAVASNVGSNEHFFNEVYDRSRICDVPCTSEFKDRGIKINRLPRSQSEQEVRILLDMMIKAVKRGTSLLNLAVGTGDSVLVSQILQQPLQQIFHDEMYMSPLIYAIINNRNEMLEYFHDDRSKKHLPSAVLRYFLKDRQITNIETFFNKRLIYVRAYLDKTTKLRVQDLIKEAKDMLNQTANVEQWQSVHDTISLNTLRDILFHDKSTFKGILSDSFLFVSTLLGEPWLFELIRSICDNDQEYQRILIQPKWEKLSVVDLLIMFASKSMRSTGDEKDIMKRAEILKGLRICPEVCLNAYTWCIVGDKRLYRILKSVIENVSIKDGIEFQKLDCMIMDAIQYNYCDFVIKICDRLKANLPTRQYIGKYICHSALYNRLDVFSHLIQISEYELDLFEKIENLTRCKKFSIFQCAVISGNPKFVRIVGDKMKRQCLSPKSEALQSILELAHSKGNIETIGILLDLIPSSFNQDFYDRLCLIASANGHERIVSDLLEKYDINTNLCDKSGFTVAHYACIYGMTSVMIVILSRLTSNSGHDFLYYARSFGHVELTLKLLENGQISGNNDCLQTFGWFNHHMITNEDMVAVSTSNSVYVGKRRNSLTIVNLLKNGDDNAAVSYLKAAQETVVHIMESDYEKFPLLHLCARYNCALSLETLMCLIKSFSSKEEQFWMSIEFKKKIPIVTAIECNNEYIVSQLTNDAVHVRWRYYNGENVLHFATRYGNIKNIQTLLKGTNNLSIVTDKFGLQPSVTMVAMGNHHALPLIATQILESETHFEHTNTDFYCFHCMLDYCIGWFKNLQNGRISHDSSFISRNISQRRKSKAGYREHIQKKRTVYYHPVSKFLQWTSTSKSDEILKAALCVMGYPQSPVFGYLFLFLSNYGCQEKVLDHAMKKRLSNVVLYILQNADNVNLSEATELAYHGTYLHMNEVVQWIHSCYCNITSIPVSLDGYSILEAAYVTWNKDIIEIFEANMDGERRSRCLYIMHDIIDHVSTKTRYRLLPHTFKVDRRKRRSDRLSDFDIVQLLPRYLHHEIFNNTLFRENGVVVYPRKVYGKTVSIETDSIRLCASTLNLSEVDVIAILFTQLCVGRYRHEASAMSPGWRRLSHINVKCCGDDASSVRIENGVLYDNVRLWIDKESGQVLVETTELPSELLPDPE